MKCYYHPEYDSETTCSKCGQPICDVCYLGAREHAICRTCWNKFTLEDQLQRNKERQELLSKRNNKELDISQVAGMAMASLALSLVIICANQMLSMAQKMLKSLKTQ
ncbi:MAG: hypothetical protein WC566_10460 [Dehalococcoidia bacterium]